MIRWACERDWAKDMVNTVWFCCQINSWSIHMKLDGLIVVVGQSLPQDLGLRDDENGRMEL